MRRLVPAPKTNAEPAPSMVRVIMAATMNPSLEGMRSRKQREEWQSSEEVLRDEGVDTSKGGEEVVS